MPIYDYKCRACAQMFEVLMRPPQTTATCPSCGSNDVERQASTFAVSSFGTQQRNLEKAREAGKSTSYDKVRSEEEAIVRHHEEHHS